MEGIDGYADLNVAYKAFLLSVAEVIDFYVIQILDIAIDLNITSVDYRCYGLLSKFQPTVGYHSPPEFITVLFKLLQHLERGDDTIKNSNWLRTLNLLNFKHSFYPKGFSYLNEPISYSEALGKIEREVVHCGKTVFIGKSSQMRLEYEFLSRNYPRIKFFESSDEIHRVVSGFEFKSSWRSKIVKSFKGINEAGLFTHTERWDRSKGCANRTAAMKQSGIVKLKNIATLDGAFLTVFILTGSLFCGAIVVFVVESRSKIWRIIVDMRRAFLFVGSLIGRTILVLTVECRLSIRRLIGNVRGALILRRNRRSKRLGTNTIRIVTTRVCDIDRNK